MVQIYFPPNFSKTGIDQISAAQLIAHRASVLGFRPHTISITGQNLRETLRFHSQTSFAQEVTTIAEEAIQAFNRASFRRGSKTVVKERDIERLLFLPNSRLQEVIRIESWIHSITGAEVLALAKVSRLEQILVPIDPEVSLSPDDQFGVMAHELGHLTRMRSGFQHNRSNAFEEGTVQENTAYIAESEGRIGPTASYTYPMETGFMQALRKSLGIATLMELGAKELEDILAEKYPGRQTEFNSLYEEMIIDLEESTHRFGRIAKFAGSFSKSTLENMWMDLILFVARIEAKWDLPQIIPSKQK